MEAYQAKSVITVEGSTPSNATIKLSLINKLI